MWHSPVTIHPTGLPLPPACPKPSLLVRKGVLAQQEHPRRAPNGLARWLCAGLTYVLARKSRSPGALAAQGRVNHPGTQKNPRSKRGALLKVNPSDVVCRR